MNARFYDANTGRFLSQDSYTGNAYEPWSQHLYSYCGNNPVNMVDPTGHWGERISSAGIPSSVFFEHTEYFAELELKYYDIYYDSADEAAIAWSEHNMPLSIQRDVEYAGIIYSFDHTFADGTTKTLYGWSGSKEGVQGQVYIDPYDYLPQETNLEAVVHSHGRYTQDIEYFSGSDGDKGFMDYWKVDLYMCYQGLLSPTTDLGGGLLSTATNSTQGTLQVISPDMKYAKAPIYGIEAYIGDLVGFFSWDALPPIK